MRVLTASIMHEGNTFAPTRTTLENFAQAGLHHGKEILEVFAGTNTELGGFIRAARDAGVALVPLLAATATPSGLVTRDAFEHLRDSLLDAVRDAGACDGVLLALHGALVAEGYDDGDGELLAAVRRLVGPKIPIVATLDMHANLTARMVESADALIGYDQLPHVDAGEKGEKAARLLFATLRGEIRPTMGWRKIPMLATPENAHTLFGPLAELIARAKELETEERVLSASIFPVQAWLDVPEQGWATLVVTDGQPELAEARAKELAKRVWERRHDFEVELVPPAEAIARALALPREPAIFANSADNAGGGAPGDNTAVLKALLAADLTAPALLTLVDPEAVNQAIQAGVGNPVTLAVGGKVDQVYCSPVTFAGYVKTIADGRFRYRGTSFTGVEVNLGRTVVLVSGGIHLVVSELKCMTIDPTLYQSVGLEPRDARIVVVKAASGFRSGYAEMARAIYILDTPGYCTPNLRSLPYRRVPRPIFPLDPD